MLDEGVSQPILANTSAITWLTKPSVPFLRLTTLFVPSVE